MCSSDVGVGMCTVLILGWGCVQFWCFGGDVCSSDVGVGMCAVLMLGWGCVQF